MAKKEFKFDEDSDDFSLGDETLSSDETPAPAAPVKKKGLSLKLPSVQMPSRKVMLLLLLVVVIAVGAAAFLVLTTPEPPPPPPPPVKKKVVVKPEGAPTAVSPPAAPVTGTPAPAPAPAPAPTATATATATAVKPAAPPAAASAKPEVKPVVAKVEPVPAAKPGSEVKPTPVAATTKPVPGGEGERNFQLKGSLFTDRDALAVAQRKLHRLGYETSVKTVKTSTRMTRLRVGLFTEDEAFQRAAELSKKFKGIFTLRTGDKVALYVGSYADLDKAREFADELYKVGITITEEPVEVVIPCKQLYFGGYATRDAAEKAANKARSAGFEAEVVKR